LRELTKHGRQISRVATLSLAEADALLDEDRTNFTSRSAGVRASDERRVELVDEAFERILAFDGTGLERLLWNAAMTLGASALIDDVAGPLLVRIGDGWVTGSVTPAQEHMGSAVLEHILERVADLSRSADGPTLVVATLPDEQHGLGARLASTVAILEGWRVTYLGTDLPPGEIATTARSVATKAVAISVVKRDDLSKTVESLSQLRELLSPGVDLLIGGAGADLIPPDLLPEGITSLQGVDGLRVRLRRDVWSRNRT
jgi:methanogenic corrinoid protein MtbC1